MILNEPETSLHPDLLAPLARLIVQASLGSQIIIVTHAAALAVAIQGEACVKSIVLEKQFGETVARDEEPAHWIWPDR